MNRDHNVAVRLDAIRKEQLSTALLEVARLEAERQEMMAEQEALVNRIRDLDKRLRKYERKRKSDQTQ